jgi:hypothetical protein
MLPWEPKGGEQAFIDRTVERRGKGWTWRKIAVAEGISYRTVYEYFDRNPHIRTEIVKNEEKEVLENIRQTCLEVAIEKKDRQLLIHLSKAKLKNYEVPVEEKREELVPAMTPDQAKALLEQRKKSV